MTKYEILTASSFGFICRTCLVHNELFLIDEVSWEGIHLKDIILNWTSLEVEKYERLPCQMCSNCIKLMYQTHDFLTKCKRVETTLKSILLKDKIKVHKDSAETNSTTEYVTKVEISDEHIRNDYINSTSPNLQNRDMDLVAAGHVNNSTLDFQVYDGPPDSEHIDSYLSESVSTDTNRSVTSGNNDDLFEIKSEISYNEDLSTNYDPDETLLREIQSIKIDIDKIRTYNKIRLRQKMKERLINRSMLPRRHRIKGSPYKCVTCEALFHSNDELKDHRNETHKKFYKFHCNICDNRYQHSGHLNDHVRIHTGEKPYRCGTCGDSFSFKSVLKRHMVRHMEIKPYRCQFCRKEFTRKHMLDYHERMHIGKRLLCCHCGKEFDTPKGVAQHERNSHPETENVLASVAENGYQCDECGKVLQSEKTFRDHVLLHGPRDFKCETCGKCFTTDARLQLHLKMTHESTMFSCHLCKNVYRQKSGLVGHLESHHEENRYFCDKCGKMFIYKSSFRQHMRIHTGDTKYQCQECERICISRRRLEAHMRTHTGEKPFTCEVCGKCFSEQANFQNHQKIHSRSRTYACNVCEKIFIDFRSLKKHINRAHIEK